MSDTDQLEQFLGKNSDIVAVELMLVDPNGIIRGKWAPVATLKKAFGDGVNFPLSLHGCDIWGREVAATGLHIESGDRDGFCRAVPHTLARVPWGNRPTAQVLLQTFEDDRRVFGGCARGTLATVVARLKEAGLFPVTAFELEFFLLKAESDRPGSVPQIVDAIEGLDNQRMYSLDALAENSGFFEDIRLAAELQSLPIDTFVKEAAPGQYEVNLNHRANALRAADDAVQLRRIITECARKHGLKATFMAKPFIEQPGNGMHVHASLLDKDGENVFAGEGGQKILENAIAGLLDTMAETSLLYINTLNGFRRMQAGSYAPTRINWGENNRSVAVRIPASNMKAKRIEHRISGADANPYLVLAAILQGMLDGISGNRTRTPPEAETGNSYERTGNELPSTMRQSLDLFKNSEFAIRALGREMVEILTALKQAELDTFAREITPLERTTYL